MKKKVIIFLIIMLVLSTGIYAVIRVGKTKQVVENTKKDETVYTVDSLEFGDIVKLTGSDISWVYIGKSEGGIHQIISNTHTSDTLTLNGKDYTTAVKLLNDECDRLYSVGEYKARSVTIEDVNRVLNYDGIKGEFIDRTVNPVNTKEPFSIAELESRQYGWLSYRNVPEGSNKTFKEYLSNFYSYMGSKYASKTTAEYNIIFTSKEYWLASSATEAYFNKGFVEYIVRSVGAGLVNGNTLYISNGSSRDETCNLRPVIELKENTKFTKENDIFWIK